MQAKEEMPRRFKVIDLFSGAGGLSLGFKRAGFEPILAVEKDPSFAETYAANFGPHVVSRDLAEIVADGGINFECDVVIGGPPCQGFSNLTGNKRDDPRRSMWRYFMEVVESTNCKVFLCENVPNFLRSPEGHSLIAHAKKLGFHVVSESVGTLMASEFGVPQNRKRAFILGSRLGPLTLPVPNGRRMSVQEALKGVPAQPTQVDLPARPATGPDLHFTIKSTEISKTRYSLVPPGGNRFDLQRSAPHLTPPCWIKKTQGGTDIFGRLEWHEPARCTIRCEFYKPEKGRYLHPSEHRPITHWEAARLQTFPDEFKWCGTKIGIAAQIGNAVPPLLAHVLAKRIMRHLMEHKAPSVRRPARSELSQLRFGWSKTVWSRQRGSNLRATSSA